LDTIPANTAFTITAQVKNLQIGVFTNAQQTYYANPQGLNAQGIIIGHTHFVIEQIESLTSTTVLDPNVFAFFKGVDDAADANGNVSVNVTAGVPPGTYRMATIQASSTHQPVLASVAQHGSMDDMVYFTASDTGAASGNNAAAGTGAAATNTDTTAAATNTDTTAAATGTGAATTGNNGGNTGNTGKTQQKGQQGKGGKFGKGRPRF